MGTLGVTKVPAKLLIRVLVIVIVMGLAWGGYEVARQQAGYSKAVELAQFGLWGKAREALAGYLKLHANDAKARLFMAELWINDDQLLSDESLPRAFAQLSQISATSPLAATARTQEAKLQFLVQHRPVAAEKSLRTAISLDDNSIEAHQILCKVLEVTQRYHETEPLFWRIYELSPPEQRVARLRDWYMSQFFPQTVNEEMDVQLGIAAAPHSALPSEASRYMRFRETEPQEPLGRAALARWTQRRGQPREALSLLDVGDEQIDNEFEDPFLLSTLIDLLIELGEYERADQRFQAWPGSREGFDYWRLRAVILEEVHGDFESALKAYDEALRIWPGPAEWRLMHRKAGCLARAGQREVASAMRVQADVVEALMEDDVHQRLRFLLGSLDNPDKLKEVVAFYRKLGRTREATAWSREVARLMAASLE